LGNFVRLHIFVQCKVLFFQENYESALSKQENMHEQCKQQHKDLILQFAQLDFELQKSKSENQLLKQHSSNFILENRALNANLTENLKLIGELEEMLAELFVEVKENVRSRKDVSQKMHTLEQKYKQELADRRILRRENEQLRSLQDEAKRQLCQAKFLLQRDLDKEEASSISGEDSV